MRCAHKDDSRRASSNIQETRLIRLKSNEKSLLRKETAKAMRNEENRAFDYVQSAIGDGVCQGFSMPTKSFSASILPETYDIGIVSIGDDSCSWILRL